MVVGLFPAAALAGEIPFTVLLNDTSLELRTNGTKEIEDWGIKSNVTIVEAKVPTGTESGATVNIAAGSYDTIMKNGSEQVRNTSSCPILTGTEFYSFEKMMGSAEYYLYFIPEADWDSKEETSASVDIWFSFYDGPNSNFVVQRQKLTVNADTVAEYGWQNSGASNQYGHTTKSGDITVADALLAAHKTVYGESFTKDTMSQYLGTSTASFAVKVFGKDGGVGGIGFTVNNRVPMDDKMFGYAANEYILKDGDELKYFIYSDAVSMPGDYYSYFDYSEIEAEAGKSVSLCLRSFAAMAWTNSPTVVPVSGAEIKLLDTATGNIGEKLGETVTDAKGNFTYSFAEAGTYILTASGKVNGKPIVAPCCVVKVKNESGNNIPSLDHSSDKKRLKVSESYSFNPAEVFSDADGDSLSYTVSVNGAQAVPVVLDMFSDCYVYFPSSAGTVTLEFKANDGNADSPTYTVTLTVTGNTAPALKGEASGTADAKSGEKYSLDLSTVFSDADGDALTYKVSVNGEEAVSAAANYSYTPSAAGTVTLAFKANDGNADSPVYTVTLTVTKAETVCAVSDNVIQAGGTGALTYGQGSINSYTV